MLPSFFNPSSSSTSQRKNYDVFISFRGTDTRNNFTSHLYKALCKMKIKTFIDDEELKRGNEISSSLLNAIQDSKIALVLFSNDYASSKWCLEELVYIIECKNKNGQIVIPVFYGVHPTDVRHQTGTYGDAFLNHEMIFKRSVDELKRWKTVLTEAASFSGFDSAVIRPESLLVKKVVTDVLKRLNHMYLKDYKTSHNLVEVDSKIKEIEVLICNGSLGIWGIGGIGKTTIAKCMFYKISHEFEVSHFIQDVREMSETSGGIADLRQKLLDAIFEDNNLSIGTTDTSRSFTQERLRHKKVFIVFDDVTDFRQIEYLIENLLFHPESRFIITTRDKHIFKICGVHNIYEVEGLVNNKALELFSKYAFKHEHPTFDYMELSNMALTYSKGLPLALKVLGSSLIDKEKQVWRSTLNKLEETPEITVQKVLEISFSGLDDDQKNIFLDIVCFFNRMPRDSIIQILNACGFFGESGLSVLVDKSLIVISSCNVITMHDLVQDMGKEIARRTSIRLWHHRDIFDVLTKSTTKNTEIAAIEGISLDLSKVTETHLNPFIFSKMDRLRVFKFYGENKFKMQVFKSIEFSSTELRYFHWFGYPLKLWPSNFHLGNLVELHMRHSNAKQLWYGEQDLGKLEHVDLSFSENLLRCPDLSTAKNLKTLLLQGCKSLVRIPSYVQYLGKLDKLNLSDCTGLRSLPSLGNLASLSNCISEKEEQQSEEKHLDGMVLSSQRMRPLSTSPFQLCGIRFPNSWVNNTLSYFQHASRSRSEFDKVDDNDGDS